MPEKVSAHKKILQKNTLHIPKITGNRTQIIHRPIYFIQITKKNYRNNNTKLLLVIIITN